MSESKFTWASFALSGAIVVLLLGVGLLVQRYSFSDNGGHTSDTEAEPSDAADSGRSAPPMRFSADGEPTGAVVGVDAMSETSSSILVEDVMLIEELTPDQADQVADSLISTTLTEEQQANLLREMEAGVIHLSPNEQTQVLSEIEGLQ